MKYITFKNIVVLLVVVALGVVLLQSKKKSESSTVSVDPAVLHQECESKVKPTDKFSCYSQNFNTYMQANGAKKTLELLDSLQKLGGYADVNCHPLAHKIGNIAYHQYGSVEKATAEYLPTCASGYYHGVLEEYLATTPNYQQAIVTACGDPKTSTYLDWFLCTHGEGHGIMEYHQEDVPLSLKDCDLIPDVNQGPELCYGGVFMENVIADVKTGHISKYVDPNNPIYPCDIVAVKYKSSCYFLSSSMILKLNGYNFADAFHTCDTKAEKDYQYLCYQSMGRDVSGSQLNDPQKIISLCELGQFDLRGNCYFGAVRDIIYKDFDFSKGISFCNTIPKDFTATCYSAVEFDLGSYKTGTDYTTVCNQMPDPYKNQCLVRKS